MCSLERGYAESTQFAPRRGAILHGKNLPSGEGLCLKKRIGSLERGCA